MKLPFLLFAFIGIAYVSTAQKGVPAFGKIERSDFDFKDCSFDPGAEAYKLIDWGSMYYVRSINAPYSFTPMFERRVRIKILKPSGLSYANLTIPFFTKNNDEKITGIDACTFNLTDDKKIKKSIVNRNAIYKRQVNKQYSEMIVVFPEVKVGSVIEYKYLVQGKSMADIKDWYFQSSIPTRFSGYQVNIPLLFHFTIQPLTVDSLEIKETKFTERLILKGAVVNNTILQKNYTMRNLPGVRNEPYMSSARDYLQRLSFQLAEIDYGNGSVVNIRTDWEDVVSELLTDQDFGGQINRKPTLAFDMITTAKKMENIEKRMAFVYNYLKSTVQWNGRETIYSYDGIKAAFQNKTGSSADINLLLISLLNHAGIEAVPILFSTRDNGLVNTALPFINQFNTVMAFVPGENNYFVLDATDRYSAYHLMPAKIVNTKGFIVEDQEGRWLDIVDTVNKYKVTTAMRGAIDTLGKMKGDVLITGSGYARKQHYENWIANKEKFNPGNLTSGNNLIEMTEASVDNLANDRLPLEKKLRYTMALNNTGELYYFTLNLFSELEHNRFIAVERRTDIDFGYQQDYTIYGNYVIPENFIFEELPQNISLIMPDTSIIFKRFISTDNNSLNVRMSVAFKRSYYTAAEYTAFAAFNKILFSKLNEPVIIKKKNLL